jgi:FMN phosphatase YigB (HAD superfamily)
MKKEVSVVITDLDNTLFDWLDTWYRTFSCLLAVLVEESGVPQATLEKEIHSVFQKYGTTEYSFLLQEIPSLRKLHPDEDLVKNYNQIMMAYRMQREKIKLYPTVNETLFALKKIGCRLVAFTESQKNFTMMRMNASGIDRFFDFVFSPPDCISSQGNPDNFIQSKKEFDDLKHAQHFEIKKGEYKPNPRILSEIIEIIGAQKEKCIYIGDNLMKDIFMAQEAGITDVYARYGQSQDTAAHELLRSVNHWTEEHIEREKTIYAHSGVITPSYILQSTFAEVLEWFDFVPFK